jgi:parallel beta-helix repeat protein
MMITLFSVTALLAKDEMEDFELVIKFNQSVQPTTQDGVLFVNIQEFDDISSFYQIDEFAFFDYKWSKHIHNMIVIPFSDVSLTEAEEIYFAYKDSANDHFAFIELFGSPVLDDPPSNFLYYTEAEPPMSFDPSIDVLGLVHDNGYYDWKIYQQFQIRVNPGEWIDNWFNRDILSLLIPPGYQIYSDAPSSFWDSDYRWIVHGPIGMWHHTEMFNNTYNAWQYSTGESVGIIISDTRVNINHPGLEERALGGFDHHYGNVDHGTMVTGVACASFAETEETTLLPTSSIGMAPESQFAAIPYHITGVLSLMSTFEDDPTLFGILKVLNMSWSTDIYHPHNEPSNTWDYIIDTYTSPYDQGGLDLFCVTSRSYNSPSGGGSDGRIYPNSLAFEYEGMMTTGAVRSDGKIVSFWRATLDSLNICEQHSRVSINAPGHIIWATDIERGTGFSLRFAGQTSGASPQVAGTAALVRSRYPWMTAAQTERQIMLGAKNLEMIINANIVSPGYGVGYWPPPDYFWGAGFLDALSSLYLHGEFTRFFEQAHPDETILLGKEFELRNSGMVIHDGIVRIEKDATVTFTSSELVIGDGVTIFFEGNSTLIIDQNSSITIGNDVVIEGFGANNTLMVYGHGQEMMLENLTVNNCRLRVMGVSLTISNSTFNCSAIMVTNGNLNLSQSSVENSYGTSIAVIQSQSVDINEVIISDSGGNGINLLDISEAILIENVYIQNCGRSGISISNSHPQSRFYKISNAWIHGSAIDGVRLYESSGLRLQDSQIQNNRIGLSILNNSCIRLENSLVRDNEWEEVYYDYSSNLLFDNGYNRIIDNNYTLGQRNQFLVYRVEGESPDTVYMRRNFWGYYDSGHIAIEPPEYRFNPPSLTEAYIISPLYTPGIPRQDVESTAAQMIFAAAESEVDDENYATAEVLLKDLIENYSNDENAVLAAKYLVFALGQLTDNYSGTKSYLQSLDFENSLPDLANIVHYLTNSCDIMMQNYDTAIDWFEDYIEVPYTEIDSVFAIIDLAYTYLLSQETGRSNIALKNKEYSVRSIYEYQNLQETLIDNILCFDIEDSEDENLPEDNFFVLNQTFPNPFYLGQPTRSGGVTISFNIPERSDVNISVYNIRGQLVDTILSEQLETGYHRVVWNPNAEKAKRVASGIYLYKLEAGNHSQVKKMLILK